MASVTCDICGAMPTGQEAIYCYGKSRLCKTCQGTAGMETRMLIEAICASLTDLVSDIRSEETESTLSILPQTREIQKMAENLRKRLGVA